MAPKEKAEELVAKYRDKIVSFLSDNMKDMNVKQCALIAVDEILAQNISTPDDYGASWTYWMQVKQELEKL